MLGPALAPPSAAPAPQTAATGAGNIEPRAAREGYEQVLLQHPDWKELIERVNQRINYTQREASRWAVEREMFENIAFYCGIHWIEYSQDTRRFSRWKAPAWFPTPMTNAIAPRVGRMASALLRINPIGKIRPNSNVPRDREAGEAGERLIQHAYDVTREEELRLRAATIAAITGTVIAEDTFNPRAGKVLRIPRGQMVDTPATEPAAQCPACGAVDDVAMQGQACPQCATPMGQGEKPKMLPNGQQAVNSDFVVEKDPTGQPIVDELPEGEIESRMIMAFNFYWDQKATSLREARWCGEATYADLDWIDENFPDFGPYVAAESGVDTANFYQASLLSLVGPSIQGSAHYGGTQFYTHGAVLRRYQELPSQKFPRGRQLIIANNVMLYAGDLIIQDENGVPTGDVTYSEYRYDEIPGRFLGRTPVSDMVPLNRKINGIDAQLILNRKTLLNPWVLAPKGSGLNPNVVAMRPGATVLYNFVGVGAAPQVVQGVALPAQIYEERNQAFQAMNELADDVTNDPAAQLPQGLRSGIALNFIRELIEELKMPRRKRWALWLMERDRKRLLLMQQYYRAERAVKCVGKGSDYQVRYLKGADIRGNTDLVVVPGSLTPKSVALRNQQVFDAIEAGLIDLQDPSQKQQAIDVLELEGFETPVGPDRRRAMKENAEMDEGAEVAINPTDDTGIHLAVHTARIKDPTFDYLTPEAKMAHQNHLAEHQQQAQVEQQAQERDAFRKAAVAAALKAASGGMQPPFVAGDVAIATGQETGQETGQGAQQGGAPGQGQGRALEGATGGPQAGNQAAAGPP